MKMKKLLIRLIILAIATVICLVIIPTVSATDPDTVAVWHFDEGVNSTAVDATGNGNDGTLSGGKFGNALYFDGSDDYINIGNNPELKPTAQITIEAWVKYDEFFSDSAGHGIVSEGYYYSNTGFMLYQSTGTPYNRVRFFICTTTGNYISSSDTLLSLDTWYHLALTYDGSTLSLYINGALDKSIPATGNIKWTPEYDLLIGSTYTTTGAKFSGTIDEVRISSTAHTFFDTANPPSVETDTVGLWHFDESTGTTAEDSSGNGNHGTIYGATWAGPTWSDGYFGKALNFDGVDDYVEVPDDASLDITGDITLEVWMYPRVINTYKSMIVKGNAEVDGKITYGLQIQGEGTDGIIRYFQYGSSYSWIDSTVPVTQNAWNYIAVTRDSSNNAKIYLNGALVGSGTLLSGPVGDYPLDIGMHNHATLGAAQYFDGKLDEIRIWDEVLSAETIKQHQCLVGEWDFDESGGTAYDTSGFENHGTLNGASWTTGKQGTALSLDGNDWVTVPDAYSLDLDQFTLEAWVKIESHDGYDCILAKGWNSGQNYGLFVTTSGTVRLQFQDSGTYTALQTYIDSIVTVDDGEWHYIVGTFDGTTLRLYIDGTLEAQGSGTTKTPDHSIYDLTFGARYDSSGDLGHYLQGAIDEVKIWSCAKSMPVADADGAYMGDEGSSISLDGSGSYDPDGTIVSYEWDLDGDGEYDDLTGISAAYTWYDNGVYPIGLKVTDDEGYWSVDETTVTVNNVAPTISSVTGDTISENGIATVSGAFTDPGTLDTFTVTIDWGEGSPESFSYSAGSTGFSETHQYLDDDPTGTPSDDYTVDVTVTDDDTGSDSDTATVTVNNVAPTVDAGDDLTTQINLLTSFSGSFTDPGTLDTHTYRWIWGDGSSDTTGTLTPTHIYDTEGVYIVTLEVTDDDIGIGTDTLRVVVLPYSDITTSGLCPDFDTEPETMPGDQFRVIYTPDVNNDPSVYKIAATNPGQFYYNVFHVGDIVEGEPFWLSIPYPFETQGANPVHVYDGADIVDGCYEPGADITDQFDISSFGCALEFDGHDDYLEIPEGVFDATDSYTFEAWIYLKDQGVDTWRGFFRRGQEGGASSEIEIYTQPYDGRAGRLTVVHNRLGAFSYKYFTTFPREEWVHLAVTYDGAAFKAYYNGVEQPQSSGISETDACAGGGIPSYIGIGYYKAFMNGMMDEVRLSDTVHDSFDITGPPEVESDTLALWHFDECTGQAVNDATGKHALYLGSEEQDEDENDPSWTGSTRYGVFPSSSDFGVYYMNIHLDYGLKQTTEYEPQPYDMNDLSKADAIIGEVVVIKDLTDYVFSVMGPVTDTQTVQNRNAFKKIRGIAGYVDDFKANVKITIELPDGTFEYVNTDGDGFFGYTFHHKGKRALYTVTATDYNTVEIWLKAGRFGEAIMKL